jgi:glyoxylase-like metal-dependent hydrolase (beta-lactamase superfamily II)
MQNPTPIQNVSVVTTGYGLGHREHVYGTRKPTLWWIFFGKDRVRLPINVYVIEHSDGLILFDAGADPRVVTDPDYWPDRITNLFMRNIFDWEITPQDNLAAQLELAGYAAADVSKVVISHFHADHVGGIGEVPQADLFGAKDAWEHMKGPHPEREMVLRRDIAILGAKWNEIAFQPTDDPALAPFTESFDLMGDGSMVVLPTPGHMPGSVSMLVRRGDGAPLLLVGDLTYGQELLEQDKTPATGNTKVLLESFAKVRALQETMSGLIILPAHDLQAGDKLSQNVTDPRSSKTAPAMARLDLED